jgi:CHASE3 domain sensor protein/protein-arginine kinase activator protein McsA
MGKEWTFGKRVGMGFAMAGLILIFVGSIGYTSTEQLIANDRLVKHTFQVRGLLGDLISLLKDCETSQRGYLISGEEAYLQPYRQAVPALPVTFEELRRLTAGNPEQQRKLEMIKPLLDERLTLLARGIELRGRSEEQAHAFIKEGSGRDTMQQIRALVGELEREANENLEMRRSQAESSAQLAKISILGGSLGGLIAIAFVAWFTVNVLSRQIGSAVHQVQSSSAELQAVANQQATSAKEQSSAMSEIATTLSELLATSKQIAESAMRVSQIADQAANAARSGDITVEKSREAMNTISRQVESIVSHMLELGKKSQHIGAVVDIVSELAEQTNILAINATIEAAGAGEAGKRFAVVADEIRKLAERVTGSTKEIRALIDDVRGAVNTTVMATETGSKSVEAGSRHFADVTTSFQQIASVALTTTDAAREIELSTKQQATAVEQVNIAINNVAQATRETEASSHQTLQTASQLATLSQALLRIVTPEATVQGPRG